MVGLKCLATGVIGMLAVSACASATPPDQYSGVFRQGFEQSDFYTNDGHGPFWLSYGEPGADLTPFVVDKGGRGTHITVRIEFQGHPIPVPEFAHSDQYSGAIEVIKFLSIESIDDDVFWTKAAAARASEDDPS